MLSIIFFGGLSVWFEVAILFYTWLEQDCSFGAVFLGSPEGLLTAMMAYFPAIAGASLCHEIIATRDEKKYYRSFAFFVLMVVFVIFSFAFILLKSGHFIAAFWLNCLAILFAVLISWISHSTQPDVANDEVPPDAPTGGPVDADLKGDESGFVVVT